MIVKLLAGNHLEFLSLKGGCTCSSGSTLVKKTYSWKSHVAAHIYVANSLDIKKWEPNKQDDHFGLSSLCYVSVCYGHISSIAQNIF